MVLRKITRFHPFKYGFASKVPQSLEMLGLAVVWIYFFVPPHPHPPPVQAQLLSKIKVFQTCHYKSFQSHSSQQMSSYPGWWCCRTLPPRCGRRYKTPGAKPRSPGTGWIRPGGRRPGDPLRSRSGAPWRWAGCRPAAPQSRTAKADSNRCRRLLFRCESN